MKKEVDKTNSNSPVPGYLKYKEVYIPKKKDLKEAVLNLKKEKNAFILADHFQPAEIQDIADYCGDALELIQKSCDLQNETIAFCGAHYIAEAIKVLHPSMKIIVPELFVRSPLTNNYNGKDLQKVREEHPDITIISDISCSLEAKAESDIIVTYSNAEKIIETFSQTQKLFFGPNSNFGKYLDKKVNRNMILWDQNSLDNNSISKEKLTNLLAKHPQAQLVAQPIIDYELLELASFVGSSSQLIDYAEKENCQQFVVIAASGLSQEMHRLIPHKTFINAFTPAKETSLSSALNADKSPMEKLYLCLKYSFPDIVIEEELRLKVAKPFEKMLAILS